MNKKLLSALVGAISLIATSNAFADDIKVVVVDTNKLVKDSTAIQNIEKQLNAKVDEFKKNASAKESEFNKEFKVLEDSKAKIGEQEYKAKSQDLAKKVELSQKKIYEDRGSVDKAYNDSMKTVQDKILEIIKSESTQNKYSLVLIKGSVLYANDAMDITPTILSKLNSQLPDVKVKF